MKTAEEIISIIVNKAYSINTIINNEKELLLTKVYEEATKESINDSVNKIRNYNMIFSCLNALLKKIKNESI